MPIDHAAASVEGMRLYTPEGLSGRLLKLLVTLGIRAGWRGWDSPRVARASLAPLREWIDAATGEADGTFAVTIGPGSARAVAQVMRPNGEIVGYLKLGFSPHEVSRLRHEAAFLQELSGAGVLSASIPRVISTDEHADSFLMLESAGSGVRSPARFLEPHARFLRALWHSALCYRGADSAVEASRARWRLAREFMDSASHAAGENALRRAGQALGGAMLPCARIHGDFTPWNCQVNGDELFVFDWEHGVRDGLAGWDLLHFVSQVELLVRSANERTVLRRILRAARSLSSSFPELRFEAGWASPLAAIYLCDVIGRESRLGREASRRTHVRVQRRRVRMLSRFAEHMPQ